MNLLEVIRSTTAFLEKKGVDSPRLNAEWLAAHCLGKKSRMELYLEFDRPLGESDLAPLRELVRRRAAREPLQHILGTVEFRGAEFLCDARALIPRPETEELVEIAIGLCPSPRLVADIGTGSGVIGISLALAHAGATVTAVDCSSDALALARANAERLGVAPRIHFLQCDLFEGVEPGMCFDLIAANLPYIPSAAIEELDPEVRHDPLLALEGGIDGLDVIRRFAATAACFLSQQGHLVLEISHDQSGAVSELLAAGNYTNITIRTDLQGVGRFVTASHG